MIAMPKWFPRIRFAGKDKDVSEYSPVTTYYMILISAVILALFGLMMSFSATTVTNIQADQNPYLSFVRNLAIIVVSVGVAFVAAWASPRFWRRWAPTIYVIAIVAQLAIIPLGIATAGNRNWVRIPVIEQTFQPSEFLKLAVCLFLGVVLANLGDDVTKVKRVLLGVGIPAGLAVLAVMLGEDMGTAMVFVALTLGAMWIAGAPGKWFPVIFVAGGGAAAFLVAINETRLRRVLNSIPGFGTPPDHTLPTQEDHGLWALASGGLIGLGPGASREKWNYLQEADTDFILAIIGEEFGLIGTLVLLITLGILVWGTLRLSSHAKDPFVRISSGAIGTWISFQGLVNIGTVTGLTPVIGVPFPLVSRGGSAFLFTALAIGVLLSFARDGAGMAKGGKFDETTGGRDPRVNPRRRNARRPQGSGTTESTGRRYHPKGTDTDNRHNTGDAS